eukprot:Gb_13775 [translate_table: standard]
MNSIKSLENVLCMKGGSGDSSYAHNSLSVQTKMVEAIKPFLESGIGGNMRVEWLRGLEGGVIRIADLGCATGINTLLAADTIVKSLKQICIRHSIGRVPEFQVYFADLPSNDFNSLFRMLPPHQLSAATGPQYHAYNNGCCLTAAPRPASRSYFAAAVTGSFYRRLFPRQSLHFVHSSISLQWLSRVPESVEDKRCPAWNGGGIFISNEAVAAAYHRQFTTDFTAFLQARAEEMVPHGGLFIALVGRNSCDVKQQDCLGIVAHHLEAAFDDLVEKGLIEEEKRESFNMPFFGPNVKELEKIVEMENSFEIESIRLLRGLALHPMREVREGEEEMFGIVVANHYRALFENVVGAHLGSPDLINHFFSRIANRAASKWQDYVSNQLDLLVAFLVRKA